MWPYLQALPLSHRWCRQYRRTCLGTMVSTFWTWATGILRLGESLWLSCICGPSLDNRITCRKRIPGGTYRMAQRALCDSGPRVAAPPVRAGRPGAVIPRPSPRRSAVWVPALSRPLRTFSYFWTVWVSPSAVQLFAPSAVNFLCVVQGHYAGTRTRSFTSLWRALHVSINRFVGSDNL